MAAALARADVTVEQQVSVDGFGPTKIGALEGKTTTAIAGDRARTDSQTQFKSKFLRVLARTAGAGDSSVRIVRLDQERVYELDPAKKQYTETSFQEIRDAATRAVQSVQSAKPAAEQPAPSGAPVDESKCEWSPARSEVKQTGEHASIAGTDASRVTITVTQTCTDQSKGSSCDFVYQLDQWLTPDLPGAQETREFWSSYAKKLNLGGDLAATMQNNAQQVFSRYKNGWGEAIKQATALKGYAVKTAFSMQAGGPQCKSDSGSSTNNNGGTADSTPQSSTPTSRGDVVSSLASGLFNKLHKKEEAKPAEPTAPGMVQIFQMSTQTVAVRTDSVPSDSFEVPAGFTKRERPAAAP
ncbi:MAG: hypothetical protein ACHQAR_05755 [Steroidobacterales bacterium]